MWKVGDRNRAILEIHIEVILDRVWRLLSCESRDALGSHELPNSNAMIKWVWRALRCSWWMAQQVLRRYSSVSYLATVGMRPGDKTFQFTWRTSWRQLILYRGIWDAEATLKGQFQIKRIRNTHPILDGCCTRCTQFVLCVHSWSWYGEIETDGLTLYSSMTFGGSRRKREFGEVDQNDMGNTSQNSKSAVRLPWLGWEDQEWVLWHVGSGLVPAVLGMLLYLTLNSFLIYWFSWWFPPSPFISQFVILNSTITWEHEVKSLLSISQYTDQVLTLSTAYTEYSIHGV